MKRFKTVASIMLTCLAVSFIIGTAYVYVKSITSNVRLQQRNEVVSAEPQLMAEDNSVRFSSIAEYVAYLNSSEYACQNTLEQNQASSASQDYYLPGVLPSNTSLASITMNDEGTTFTYSYDIDFSNIFDFNTDDDVIAEMTRTMIAKEYQLDFVSNHRLYAQNLASCLGADLVSSARNTDFYRGAVYANIHDVDEGTTRRITIGEQRIYFIAESDSEFDGKVLYYFSPLMVTEREFAAFANLEQFGIDLLY